VRPANPKKTERKRPRVEYPEKRGKSETGPRSEEKRSGLKTRSAKMKKGLIPSGKKTKAKSGGEGL